MDDGCYVSGSPKKGCLMGNLTVTRTTGIGVPTPLDFLLWCNCQCATQAEDRHLVETVTVINRLACRKTRKSIEKS